MWMQSNPGLKPESAFKSKQHIKTYGLNNENKETEGGKKREKEKRKSALYGAG